MKHIKALGFATVTAMSLMAFVGVGSASATVLCKTNITPCTEAWRVRNGTILKASLEPGTTTVLRAGIANVTCTESAAESEVTKEGAAVETVSGPVHVVTFGNCNCEEVTVSAGGILEIHYTSGMNGTLISKNTTETVKCAGVTCKYITVNGGTHIGTLTGSDVTGGAATMDIKAELELEEGGLFCNKKAEWTASYIVTSPNPLYVTAS